MKDPLVLTLAVLSSTVAAAQPLGQWVEFETMRSGTPFQALAAQDRLTCRRRCEGTLRCNQYTFHEPASECRLYATVGTPSEDIGVTSGIRGGQSSLQVVYANLRSGTTFLGRNHMLRIENLATETQLAGITPDLVVLQESAGWASFFWHGSWDSTGFENGPDLFEYDQLSIVLDRFSRTFGVTYRIASHTGMAGPVTGAGDYFQAFAVLYRSDRLVNGTQGSQKRIESHESGIRGTHLRRGLPNCNGALQTINSSIDGPYHFENCTFATPAAPAWHYEYSSLHGLRRRIGSFNRFFFKHDARNAIEFFNVHFTQKLKAHGPPEPDTILEVMDRLGEFERHDKGGTPKAPVFYTPLMMGDVNINCPLGEDCTSPNKYSDQWFDRLRQNLPAWRIHAWSPNDSMGLLQGNQDLSSGTTWSNYEGRVARYESRLSQSVFLPVGVTNCDMTAPENAGANVIGDHCAHAFRLDWIDPDPLPTLVLKALPEHFSPRLSGNTGVFDVPANRTACLMSTSCQDWLCRTVKADCSE